MRHDEPMASPETKQVSAPSCVATPDALADRAGGNGCHVCPPAPISATPAAPRDTRDPLTDPRTGDIVTAYDGSVLEVTGAVLGYGACVWIREDSTRYTLDHDRYRDIVRGGSVIRRAEEVGA